MARGVPERNVGLSSCFVLEQDAFQVKQNGIDSQPQKRTLASWMWFPVLQVLQIQLVRFHRLALASTTTSIHLKSIADVHTEKNGKRGP